MVVPGAEERAFVVLAIADPCAPVIDRLLQTFLRIRQFLVQRAVRAEERALLPRHERKDGAVPSFASAERTVGFEFNELPAAFRMQAVFRFGDDGVATSIIHARVEDHPNFRSAAQDTRTTIERG